MLTSIIIAARNEDPRMLRETLAGLRATTSCLLTEIIVVDDASINPIDPASLGDARLLRHPTARGVCESRRNGAMLAMGDVLVWLDAHMSFGDFWLQQLLVQCHDDTLVCSPFWTYDLKDCMCWGADFVWNAVRDYTAGNSPGLTLRHRVERPNTAASEVPAVIGACYAMSREAFATLGGLCPHFKIWGVDEQDISARAWMSGLRVVCATHAQVGHYSRNQFPYPIQFEHLEFNQLVLIRSLFQRDTIARLEAAFQPFPAATENWLTATDLSAWRRSIQRRRKMTDVKFFERFLPELAVSATNPNAKPKHRAGKGRSA
jgi:glycosyltransferase involved in cell wall biosynthesis